MSLSVCSGRETSTSSATSTTRRCTSSSTTYHWYMLHTLYIDLYFKYFECAHCLNNFNLLIFLFRCAAIAVTRKVCLVYKLNSIFSVIKTCLNNYIVLYIRESMNGVVISNSLGTYVVHIIQRYGVLKHLIN